AGARLVAVHDPGYPPPLMDLRDPPAGLFVVGPLEPDAPRVAIVGARRASPMGDRKSTRLNSSHVATSYAVFCLKKKTSTSSAPTISSRAREGVAEEEAATRRTETATSRASTPVRRVSTSMRTPAKMATPRAWMP